MIFSGSGIGGSSSDLGQGMRQLLGDAGLQRLPEVRDPLLGDQLAQAGALGAAERRPGVDHRVAADRPGARAVGGVVGHQPHRRAD